MVLICTKSQEIVDGYIVLPYYGLGFLFIYFCLSFTCWFFYLVVWVRMEKMKNFSPWLMSLSQVIPIRILFYFFFFYVLLS